MKTVEDIFRLTLPLFEKHGILRPKYSLEILLAHVLNCSRLNIYLSYHKPLLENELEKLRDLIKQRARGVPVEYIVGEVDFCDVKLQVNQSVLIPRVETEHLVYECLKRLEANQISNAKIFDVCTGSGCIALGMKKKLPSAEVIASDLSAEALKIAKENAKANALEVTFLQGDLLTPYADLEKADLIICNPPYISKKEWLALDREVKDFEPQIALLAETDGMQHYSNMAVEAKKFLKKGGILALEIGYTQGKKIQEIFSLHGWNDGKILQDWSGKDRFFFLENV